MQPDRPTPCILVVEDEPMLAFALQAWLEDAGFSVAGPTGKLAEALALIDSGVCSAAILDANLKGVSAAPAALALASRAVPFITLSGYAAQQQDPAFAGGRYLQKPCPPDRLLSVLRAILPPG